MWFHFEKLKSCNITSLYNLVSLYSKLFLPVIVYNNYANFTEHSFTNIGYFPQQLLNVCCSYLDPRPPYVVLYYFFLSNYVQESSAAIPTFCATWFVSKIY